MRLNAIANKKCGGNVNVRVVNVGLRLDGLCVFFFIFQLGCVRKNNMFFCKTVWEEH